MEAGARDQGPTDYIVCGSYQSPLGSYLIPLLPMISHRSMDTWMVPDSHKVLNEAFKEPSHGLHNLPASASLTLAFLPALMCHRPGGH